MFEEASAAVLLGVMRDAQRAKRVSAAREILAAGRFGLQQMAAMGNVHEDWCVDDWDVIAAEVGAELGVSQGQASALMALGHTLLERMPRLAQAFLAGDIDVRDAGLPGAGVECAVGQAGARVGGLDGPRRGSRRAAGGQARR